MKIKEIIVAAAELIGDDAADGVKGYLEEGVEGGEALTKSLLRCFHLVEKQLAEEYLPLKREETVETDTGAVAYAALERKPLRIVKVTDEWGMSLRFSTHADYIKAQTGRLTITYTFAPDEKEIEAEAELHYAVTKRLCAYGVAAEYCLTAGLYEEAEVWEKKYKNGISAAYRQTPCKKIRGRNWQ